MKRHAEMAENEIRRNGVQHRPKISYEEGKEVQIHVSRKKLYNDNRKDTNDKEIRTLYRKLVTANDVRVTMKTASHKAKCAKKVK